MTKYLVEAQRRDIPFLISLMSNIYHEFHLGPISSSEIKDLVELDVLSNNGLVKVIQLDGEPVGSIVMKKINNTTVELRNWYLMPSARKSGLGKLSLDYSIDWARKNNFTYIQLFTSSKFIRAVEIYKSLGFVKHDLKPPCSCDLSYIKKIQ
jgi:GNAT superfamily N-acetyltransferase